MFHYIIISCEVQEILSCLRCLDAGRPGDYLYKLPDFLQQHCTVDLYALTKVADAASLLAALAGTPYAALLAPLRQIPAGRKLLVYAEPYLEGYRHEALVNLAKEGPGPASPGKAPSLWDYIALDCDIEGALQCRPADPPGCRPGNNFRSGAARLHGPQAGPNGSSCLLPTIFPHSRRRCAVPGMARHCKGTDTPS